MNKIETMNLKNVNGRLSDAIIFLGMYIDSGLNWTYNIEKLSARLTSNMYALNKLKHAAGFRTTGIAYHSELRAHMAYAVMV